MAIKKSLKIIIGLIISLVFLYKTFGFVGWEISWVNDFSWSIVVIAALLNFLMIFVKSLRLKVLLGGTENLTVMQMTRPVLIRHFLNASLPGNAGDIVEPLVLAKITGGSFSKMLPISIAVRLLDFTTIFSLYISGLFLTSITFDNRFNYIFLAPPIVVISLVMFVKYGSSTIAKLKISLISNMISEFNNGLNYLYTHRKQLYKAFGVTIGLWIGFCFIDYLLLYAFPVLRPLLSVGNVLILSGAIVVSQMIPSAPSSVGVFNYFVVAVIKQFAEAEGIGFEAIRSSLIPISMVLLLVSILPDITWGMVVAYKEGFKFKHKSNIYSCKES